jgi:hypothetical protein
MSWKNEDIEEGTPQKTAQNESTRRIQEAVNAKMFPVIVICVAVIWSEWIQVPNLIQVVIIHETRHGTWQYHWMLPFSGIQRRVARWTDVMWDRCEINFSACFLNWQHDAKFLIFRTLLGSQRLVTIPTDACNCCLSRGPYRNWGA